MEAERQKAEEEALQKRRQQAEARAARTAVPTDERYIPRPASPALERSPTPSPSPSRARQACSLSLDPAAPAVALHGRAPVATRHGS